LEIEVSVIKKFVQNKINDLIELQPLDPEIPYFDENSSVYCNNCCWTGLLKDTIYE